MSKIETITPVHIGSGEKILCLKKDGYLYDLNKILRKEKLTNNKEKLDKILEYGQKNNINMSTANFKEILALKDTDFTDDEKVSNDYYYAINSSDNINLFLIMKSMDKLIIPGSTIRGWLNNLFFYYLLDSEPFVKDYVIKNIKTLEKRNNILINIEKTIAPFKQFLMVNDIMIDTNPYVYNLIRYTNGKSKQTKSDTIPGGNVEMIPMNFTINSKIYDQNISEFKTLIEVMKEKHLKIIRENKNKYYEEKEVLTISIEKFIYFLNNLNQIIKETNKKHMKYVINKEIEYLQKTTNKKVKVSELMIFYNSVLSKLDNGEIITQIGKYTNYFDKSMLFILEDVYQEKFKSIFTPNREKTSPIISSMNLINDDCHQYPLGFIKITL